MYDEFYPLGLSMRRLHHIDELRICIGVGEEYLNQFWYIHGIEVMKPRTKLGKMVKEFEGRDVHIERDRVL